MVLDFCNRSLQSGFGDEESWLVHTVSTSLTRQDGVTSNSCPAIISLSDKAHPRQRSRSQSKERQADDDLAHRRGVSNAASTADTHCSERTVEALKTNVRRYAGDWEDLHPASLATIFPTHINHRNFRPPRTLKTAGHKYQKIITELQEPSQDVATSFVGLDLISPRRRLPHDHTFTCLKPSLTSSSLDTSLPWPFHLPHTRTLFSSSPPKISPSSTPSRPFYEAFFDFPKLHQPERHRALPPSDHRETISEGKFTNPTMASRPYDVEGTPRESTDSRKTSGTPGRRALYSDLSAAYTSITKRDGQDASSSDRSKLSPSLSNLLADSKSLTAGNDVPFEPAVTSQHHFATTEAAEHSSDNDFEPASSKPSFRRRLTGFFGSRKSFFGGQGDSSHELKALPASKEEHFTEEPERVYTDAPRSSNAGLRFIENLTETESQQSPRKNVPNSTGTLIGSGESSGGNTTISGIIGGYQHENEDVSCPAFIGGHTQTELRALEEKNKAVRDATSRALVNASASRYPDEELPEMILEQPMIAPPTQPLSSSTSAAGFDTQDLFTSSSVASIEPFRGNAESKLVLQSRSSSIEHISQGRTPDLSTNPHVGSEEDCSVRWSQHGLNFTDPRDIYYSNAMHESDDDLEGYHRSGENGMVSEQDGMDRQSFQSGESDWATEEDAQSTNTVFAGENNSTDPLTNSDEASLSRKSNSANAAAHIKDLSKQKKATYQTPSFSRRSAYEQSERPSSSKAPLSPPYSYQNSQLQNERNAQDFEEVCEDDTQSPRPSLLNRFNFLNRRSILSVVHEDPEETSVVSPPRKSRQSLRQRFSNLSNQSKKIDTQRDSLSDFQISFGPPDTPGPSSRDLRPHTGPTPVFANLTRHSKRFAVTEDPLSTLPTVERASSEQPDRYGSDVATPVRPLSELLPESGEFVLPVVPNGEFTNVGERRVRALTDLQFIMPPYRTTPDHEDQVTSHHSVGTNQDDNEDRQVGVPPPLPPPPAHLARLRNLGQQTDFPPLVEVDLEALSHGRQIEPSRLRHQRYVRLCKRAARISWTIFVVCIFVFPVSVPAGHGKLDWIVRYGSRNAASGCTDVQKSIMKVWGYVSTTTLIVLTILLTYWHLAGGTHPFSSS